MNTEPVKLLSTSGLARRVDRCHATVKRRLLQTGTRADAIALPSFGLLYAESRVDELRQLFDADPAAVSVATGPEATV